MRDDLVVAFDLLEIGYKEWGFVQHGFIPLFIGLAWQIGPKLFPKVSEAVGQLESSSPNTGNHLRRPGSHMRLTNATRGIYRQGTRKMKWWSFQ